MHTCGEVMMLPTYHVFASLTFEKRFDFNLCDDLDECCQQTLSKGERSRGLLIVQVPRQYADCALIALMRVVIKPDASQKLDGYHTIPNLTDELILERTTLFCRKGYDSICSSSCDCLRLGYKERHVFKKKVVPHVPIDCMFLTNWPYSHR